MIFIYVAAGWVVGILTASFLKLPTEIWLLLLLLPLGYLAIFWRNLPLRKWHFVLIFFVLGALRYQLALPDEIAQQLKQFNEQGSASLIGVVVAEPDVRQAQALVRVAVQKIQTQGEWREVHGLALVSVPRDTRVSYGDEVQVEGAPETPPDGADFSYRDYLAREHVFTLIRRARLYTIASGKGDAFWAALYQFKHNAELAINQLLPEPSAALLTGILLGDDRGIPPELKQDFADTNTAHIIAISGFNIAVLIGVLAIVFRRPANVLQARVNTNPSSSPAARLFAAISQNAVTILIILFLILYTLLVGAEPAVVRACIMGALVVIALQLGRQSWAFNALAISIFIMTLLNPYVLWDVGFQLSFLATLGLLIYAPRLQNHIETLLKKRMTDERARRVVEFFKDALIVTAAAFFVTAPLIIVYFHRVSIIGFLTNFLILPVQPAIMILGGAAALLQMLSNTLRGVLYLDYIIGALAQVIAWAAYVALQYTILVVQATAAIPFGSFEINNVGAPFVIVFYLALALLTRFGIRQVTGVFLSRVWVMIALLALITMFVWTTALASPDPRTRITFIAAADGDATFLRTPRDERILINGTAEPGVLLSFIGTQLPPWDRRIDVVMATHLEDDNLASLNAVLERYTVGKIVEPFPSARPGVSYAKWRELIDKQQLAVIAAEQGTALRVSDLEIKVLYPDAETDSSNVALRVVTNGQNILLAPTLRASDRAKILTHDTEIDADIAVLPNEIEKEWLERVSPETVVLFVGKNPRDKPSAEFLKTLGGVTLLRTDEFGTITFVLDGEQLRILHEK